MVHAMLVSDCMKSCIPSYRAYIPSIKKSYFSYQSRSYISNQKYFKATDTLITLESYHSARRLHSIHVNGDNIETDTVSVNSKEQIETKETMASESNLRRERYPPIEPYNSGMLKVSDIHSLYWEQCGNPKGYPVIFLHGGPGGGISADNRKFFDPEFYNIILFDQRGSGKSTPRGCLDDNTTWDLIDDIEKLRTHLGIEEWQLFGGSWGSTLSLAYAISHPQRVTGIVLRGIFLLRKKELDWFYEGGVAAIYPDAWEKFRDHIPEDERDSLLNAYHKRLNSSNEETRLGAARSWSIMELATSYLLPNKDSLDKGEDDAFALTFARIENHYFKNKGFFPTDSFLLDNIEKIRHIPCTIVQGRYDVVCPMMSAWDLHKIWPEAEFKIVPDAGHSANEPGTTAELVAANERLKELHQMKA